jgi:hypothetical protein
VEREYRQPRDWVLSPQLDARILMPVSIEA